ncbi:hypothetical protein BS78_05G109300 [Paspalum vaginatum]|nr:hypothetical protein BS78_05G109300 [Paspalum vaginatum]
MVSSASTPAAVVDSSSATVADPDSAAILALSQRLDRLMRMMEEGLARMNLVVQAAFASPSVASTASTTSPTASASPSVASTASTISPTYAAPSTALVCLSSSAATATSTSTTLVSTTIASAAFGRFGHEHGVGVLQPEPDVGHPRCSSNSSTGRHHHGFVGPGRGQRHHDTWCSTFGLSQALRVICLFDDLYSHALDIRHDCGPHTS